MNRRTLPGLAIILALAALPIMAFAQGAAEYAVTTSGAATSAAKAGSAMGRSTSKLAGRLQGTMGKSVGNSKGTAYRSVNPMEDNKKRLELKSQAGGGTLHIDSVPEKATILVDGDRVAYTPADLKIPEGKHLIEVNDPTRVIWRKAVTMSRGETLSLNAELEEKYKSEIVLSIQK